MALASRVGSRLNPDAPLFIPAAYQQVEDFSPEWWNLVHSSPWFRDYWLSERHEDDDMDAFAADLPEDIDEFTELELQLEEAVLQGIHGSQEEEDQHQFTQADGNDEQVVEQTFISKSCAEKTVIPSPTTIPLLNEQQR